MRERDDDMMTQSERRRKKQAVVKIEKKRTIKALWGHRQIGNIMLLLLPLLLLPPLLLPPPPPEIIKEIMPFLLRPGRRKLGENESLEENITGIAPLEGWMDRNMALL